MLVRFLGTADANPDCGRLQSSVLISIQGREYIFDCGDGIATRLWNDSLIDLNTIDALFITHFDPDHFGGLLCVLQAMHQRIKTVEPARRNENMVEVLLPSEKICGYINGMLPETRLSDYWTGFKKEIRPYGGNSIIYNNGILSVRSFPTKHTPESHGFCIQAEGKKLVYSGDILSPEVLEPFLDGCDLLIIEGAHFPAESITHTLEKHRIARVAVTHINRKDYEMRNEYMQRLAPLAAKMQVSIAKDGMEFQL